MQQDFHQAYNDFVRGEVSKYTDEQGWPLDISYIAGFTAGSGEIEKVAAAVQAGDPPDLILHTFTATQVRNLYVVQPVSDVVEAIEEVFGPAAPFLRQTMILDGEWWAIPYHQRSDGGWYRRDLFDAVGVDLQKTRRYDHLREETLKVTDPDNEIYGWGMTVNRNGDGNYLINRIKTGWGGAWQDETGKFIRTNSPEVIAAMDFIKETYTDPKYEPILPPGVLAWSDTGNNEAYLAGILAFTQNAGTVYASAVRDKNPVADVTNYLKPPGGPVNEEFLSINSKNWYILRGAKNTEAAKQMVLEFSTNLERIDTMLASSPAFALPAYTDLWEMSDFVKGFEPAYQQKSAAMDESGIDQYLWPGPPNSAIDAITESGIYNDLVNSVLTGADTATAVKEAHDRMVVVFKEFDLPGEEG
jgi:multiple sugar transport system substrate-binding protein